MLATGALAHLLRDGDSLTLAARKEAAPLFRAAPGLDEVHDLPPNAGPGALFRTWRALSKRDYDVVIDARGGFLGAVTPASKRVATSPPSQVRSRAEEWADAVGAERALMPKIWLDEAARRAGARVAPAERLLLIAPGGAARRKCWPSERFAAVARRLIGGPLAGAEIAVLGAAPRDAEITAAIVASLDADGIRACDLAQGVDLLTAAALMERATLCIGNDNALTHVAAAMGAPTLTLFGPTDERVRAPCGSRARTLRARSLASLATSPEFGGRRAMEDIGIDAAESAALDVLSAGGLR